MKKLLGFLLLLPSLAMAQTSPLDISKGVTIKNMNNAFSSKVDVANGSANGLIRTGGSDTGTDISSANLSADMTGAEAASAINTATATANNAIPQSWRGANTTSTILGVAPLDENAFVSVPLASGSTRIGDWSSIVTPYAFSQGYESNVMGGVDAVGSNYAPRSLFIAADPYGNYSTACGMGIAMMGATGSSQFPISEGDYRTGAAAVVGLGGFDTVASCILNGNTPARFILTATSYTATSVNLATALTADQASMIHQGMYITTNSPDPDVTTTTPTDGTIPSKNLYAGFVSAQPSAGDTSISVYAWAVPGLGSTASGQIPQTTTLDTVWSARTSPTVFLGGGSAGSSFSNNWFVSVDAGDLTPSTTNKSLIHQFTPLEVDLNVVNGTAPDNSIDWQGINMNAGHQPAALTTDSRQVFLGGNINHHLEVNGACGNWDYNSLAGGGFVDMPTPCGLSTGDVTEQVMQGWTEWISGQNKITMMLTADLGNTSATAGWEQAVLKLGPTVDGTRTQSGDYGGSKQGDIEWNQGAQYGSITLCGYGTNCGYRLNGDGSSSFSDPATFNGLLNVVKGIYGIDSSGSNLAQFYPASTGDWTVGTSVSGGGSIRGVNTYYGSAVNVTGSITAEGGGDFKGSVYLEGGNPVYLKPSTLSNDLQPGLYGLDSYTIATTGNVSASIGLLASSIQAASGGTGGFSTAARSMLNPDGYGNWSASFQSGSTTVTGGAFKPATYTLSTLPTANETDGNQLWCSDCKLNSITGVLAYWHASASKWTDSQNNDLAN